jgi:hypothetical protein
MRLWLIRRSNNLPGDVAELFNTGQVATTYELSIGAGGAFVFSYKTKTGETEISKS